MKHIIFKLILIISLAINISGCYFVSFEDVSSLSNYSQYVGKNYKSQSPTIIYRVSFDLNYKPEPSHYVIKSPPGFSGPEVISRKELPTGTTFEVLKVFKCTNCFLDFKERVKLIVKLTSTELFNDREVEINIEQIGGTFIPLTVKAANNAVKQD